jgi:hypothetical protein
VSVSLAPPPRTQQLRLGTEELGGFVEKMRGGKTFLPYYKRDTLSLLPLRTSDLDTGLFYTDMKYRQAPSTISSLSL